LKKNNLCYDVIQNTEKSEVRILKRKRLIFGAIFVEKYQDFEAHLHNTYAPLKGSNKKGGISLSP